MLGTDAEFAGHAAVDSVKIGGQLKLRCRRLIGRMQVEPLRYTREDSLARIFCQGKNYAAVKKEELPLYAQKLRALRDKLGFRRQTEFAAALGTRQATVSRWLNGTARPLPEIFMRIAGLAQGADRSFFMREAGIPLNDAGELDFGATPLRREISKGAIVPLNQHNKDRKAGHTSQPDVVVHWNPELLVFVVETLNGKLKERRLKLPDSKYAQAVVLCYEFCIRLGRRDAETVEKFLSMVA
jgi:transcriptional regulator with XRE-family HTH domain